MNPRLLAYLTLLVLLLMGLILLLNLSTLFRSPLNERYLAYNGVRGMAVERQQTLWTLNFEQQNSAIELFNRALAVKKYQLLEGDKPPYEQIHIYRFQAPDLIVQPLGYQDNRLIFHVQEWHPAGDLMDATGGELDTLLRSCYD